MTAGVPISDKKRTLILINIIISCVATTLLMTALNTALPSVRADFGIDASTGQWIISGYSLTMGIVMPLTAFLVRRVRTKRLYLTGLLFVGCGLLIGLFSVGFASLMFGRVLQACGDGILLSMSQIVILTIFPPEKRGAAMGWYGLAVGAAPVIAPTLGGILVDLISWRAIFALVLVIVAVAFVMACLVFANVLDTGQDKLDLVSFVLSIFAFGGITLGIGNLSNYGLSHPSVWIILAVGAVAAVFFVRRELALSQPFLNVRVFTSKEYTVGLISEMLCYLIMMGISILMPLYVQSVMGYSATISGLVILPGALCNAIISPFAGRIYDRTGMRRLSILGAILIFLATFAMCFVSADTSLTYSVVCYIIRSFALGCVLMPFVTWGASHVEHGAVADATALMSSLRTIAGSIGSAVAVGVMSMAAARSVATYGATADMHGIHVAFVYMTVISVALILLSVFLVKEPKNSS